MSKTRYKIRKEQLERVVESFVMESAKGGSMIEKNAAKKHKMSMGAEQHDDMGEGMEKAKEVKKAKMSQAPEAKKHMKGSVSENKYNELKRLMEENNISEEEMAEAFGWLKRTQGDEDSLMKDLDVKARSLRALTGKVLDDTKRKSLIDQAKSDNWCGSWRVTGKGPEGELVYDDCKTKAGKGASVTSISR